MNYLDIPIGMYKRSSSGKGFYRYAALTLREIINKKAEDSRVLAFRKSKTPDNPKGDRDLKGKIPAFTPAGDYGQDHPRVASNPLQTSTGLIQLDFDVEVTKARVTKIFEKYKFIALAQISCGGKGFYLLVRALDSEGYEEYFNALVDFFLEEESLQADEAVSSVNELRFMSLSREIQFREDATIWNKRVKKAPSPIDKILIPMNGKPVLVPDDMTDLHYVDITAYAGKNNANGVPLADALAAFPMDKVSKDSHLFGKPEVVKQVMSTMYDKYSEQHGEAIVSASVIMGKNDELSLPQLKFDKTDTPVVRSLAIVKNILQNYQFKTDDRLLKNNTYRFNGKCWEPIDDSALRNFLSSASISSGNSVGLSEQKNFRDMMSEQIKDLTNTAFEIPNYAFNLNNGVVTFDARSGKVMFEPHSDQYNFTYCMDYDYDPENTKAPIYSKFINRALSVESQSTFWQYVATALVDLTVAKIEAFMFMVGSGANGKSTLMDLLRDLLGAVVGTFSLENITSKNAERAQKAAYAGLYNKILAVSPEDRFIDDAQLWKKIGSREKIVVKRLYSDEFETQHYARCISCMNEAPRIDGVHSMIRRTYVIPMTAVIERHEMDVQLGMKLRDERTQIFNILCQSFEAVVANGYRITASAEVDAETIRVIDEGDPIMGWLKSEGLYALARTNDNSNKTTVEDKYRKQLNHKSDLVKLYPQSDMYTAFRKWCEEEGLKFLMTKRGFLQRIREFDASRLGGETKRFVLIMRDGFPIWAFGQANAHSMSTSKGANAHSMSSKRSLDKGAKAKENDDLPF